MAKKTTKTLPRPPRHLSADSRAWWRDVVRSTDLGPVQLMWLEVACESFESFAKCAEILRREGLTYTDRFGTPRPRPEVRLLTGYYRSFVHAARELKPIRRRQKRLGPQRRKPE